MLITEAKWNNYDDVIIIEYLESGDDTMTKQARISYRDFEGWAAGKNKFQRKPVRMTTDADEVYENEDDVAENHLRFREYTDDATLGDVQEYADEHGNIVLEDE